MDRKQSHMDRDKLNSSSYAGGATEWYRHSQQMDIAQK